jgi:hypothetical protein
MADKFVVTGIPAFNGDYPIDMGTFSMRELNIIKRMSGVRAGELSEAFAAGDSDVIFAMAVVAVRRNGRDWEAFEKIGWEVDFDAYEFVTEEDAADEPVPLTPANENGATGNSSEQPDPSGQPSPEDGDSHQEKNLRAIGSPA